VTNPLKNESITSELVGEKNIEFVLVSVEEIFYVCISDFRLINRGKSSLCRTDKTITYCISN